MRAADLTGFQPYREALPLEHRQEVTAPGITTRVVVDPEDPDYQPAPKAGMAMIQGNHGLIAR